MEHRIYVSGDGPAADGLAAHLGTIPGVSVETRGSGDRLALDPASVSLVIAGLGSVNALIAALGGIWAAKIAAARGSPPTRRRLLSCTCTPTSTRSGSR